MKLYVYNNHANLYTKVLVYLLVYSKKKPPASGWFLIILCNYLTADCMYLKSYFFQFFLI